MNKFNGVLGIDLGTTNTCFAYMKGTDPEVVPNRKGSRTTMSVVYYPHNGGIPVVGEDADSQGLIYPESVIYASKRIMGLTFDDPKVKQSMKHVRYKMVNVNGKVMISIETKENNQKKEMTVSPEQVAASVLSEVKASFAHTYGFDPKDKIDTVITVPAYFTDSQKQATMEAGKIAGLNVVRIINEPTAAALAYVYNEKISKSQTIAVYDLGGGTFDISIVHIDPPSGDEKEYVVQVLSTAGNAFLGGEDFDDELYRYLVSNIQKTYPDIANNIINNPNAQQRLRDAAQKAKKTLSTAQSTKISLPFLYVDSQNTVNYETEILRSQLEHMVKHIIERTKEPCESALKDAKISQVDEVLLVGGMTRMPAVADFVQKIFNKKPNANINPDEAVALGAAIQGAIIKGVVKDIVLLDVAPLSLGIETLGGVFTVLIPRNTTIPAKRSQIFSTAADNQTEVGIRVFQGERPMAANNKLLGEFRLAGIPSAPRGVPQIEVTFDIDVNGLVQVSAKDKNTGKEQSITIQGSGQLSPEDLERFIQEAEKNREIDQKRLAFVNLVSEADNKANEAEKSVETWKGANFDHSEIDSINNAKDELRKQVESLREMAIRNDGAENVPESDLDSLRDATKSLNDLLLKVGEEFYKKQSSDSQVDPKKDDDNQSTASTEAGDDRESDFGSDSEDE